MNKVVVIGGANPTIIRTIEDINKVQNKGLEILGIIDNSIPAGQRILGERVLGGFEILGNIAEDIKFINTIASNTTTREETTRFLKSTGRDSINIIHPSVNTKHVTIGEGNIICEGMSAPKCFDRILQYPIEHVLHCARQQNW